MNIVFDMGHHSLVHSYSGYVHKRRTAMEEPYAIDSLCAVGARNKSYYGLKANSVDLQPNNHILVRNCVSQPKDKLS